ncbi:MAG: hypothetical protein U1E76_09840 [Planctomycetota bacterium]
MQRQLSMAFYMALCAALIALGFRGAPQRSATERLAGAVLAGDCPIHDRASDALTTSHALPSCASTRTHSWSFVTSDAPEQVAAFYAARLPGSVRATETDGSTSFTYRPATARQHECVSVIIRAGELEVHEIYDPERDLDRAEPDAAAAAGHRPCDDRPHPRR